MALDSFITIICSRNHMILDAITTTDATSTAQ